MSVPDIEKLYDEQIRALPRAAQLALLARIATDLAASSEVQPRERGILELHGLGADRFSTNDRRLTRVAEVRIVVLDDLEQPVAS